MYVVSACLLGINCKYTGGNNRNENVISFLEDKEYVLVCPESSGGLPTPRIPSERLNGIVINKEGIDVTKEFNLGCETCIKYINSLGEIIEGAILKKNSPSCGFGTIYDGTFTNTLVEGNGVFAEKLNELGIKIYNEEEIK